MARVSSGARHDLSLPKGLSRGDTEHPGCDEPARSPTTWSAKPEINVGRAPETSLVGLVHVPMPISDGATALIKGDVQHQSRDPGHRGDRGRFPQALTDQATSEAGLGSQGRDGGQQSTDCGVPRSLVHLAELVEKAKGANRRLLELQRAGQGYAIETALWERISQPASMEGERTGAFRFEDQRVMALAGPLRVVLNTVVGFSQQEAPYLGVPAPRGSRQLLADDLRPATLTP